MRRTTKLLIEAGLIPKNALIQMSSWRLVPEDLKESHGKKRVSLDRSNQDSVAAFVEGLTAAVSEDMAEFRETEMPPPGEEVLARPCFQGMDDTQLKVFLDKMGRLYVPPTRVWYGVAYVTVAPLEEPLDEKAYHVVRRENRYQGDTLHQLVLYLARDKDADEDDS